MNYSNNQQPDYFKTFCNNVINIPDNVLNNLVNQAKQFGMSDNTINEGLNIINSIKKNNMR